MQTNARTTIGEVIVAAFEEAGRRTRVPEAQAQIAAELVARMLKGNRQLLSLLAA